MKLLYTLFLFLLFSVTASAQTLTQLFNEPIQGDEQRTVRLDTSLMSPITTLSISGQNVNWDFSLLKTASDPSLSVFASTVAVPSATAYAGCTLVQDDNGSYTYIKSVSTPTTRTELLGLTLQGSVVNLTNSAIAAVYPISFASTFSDNVGGTAVFTGSTLPLSGRVSYTADGTGTLTLADGFVYNNVLRVKSVQTFTATYLFLPIINVKRVSYDFYDASLKFPVLTINYQTFDFLGQGTTAGSYRGNSLSFTGISKETGPSQLTISPNPSTGKFQIGCNPSTAGNILVTDAAGKIVLEKNYQSGSVSTEIDLSTVANGMYFLHINSGTEHTTAKLLKN